MCSLRRDVLAQATQGLEKGSRSTREISLRRDPSRLGETLVRSKAKLVAWATFRAKFLGELPVHLA